MSERSFVTSVPCVGPVTVSQDPSMEESAHPWFIGRDGRRLTAYFITLVHMFDACEEIARLGETVSKFNVPVKLFATLRAEWEHYAATSVIAIRRGAEAVPEGLAPGTACLVPASFQQAMGAVAASGMECDRPLWAPRGYTSPPLTPGGTPTLSIAPAGEECTVNGVRFRAVEVGEDEEKRRRFAKALDKALPASMDRRPGEQCKVCGEAAPLTAREPWSQRTNAPNFTGWARFIFPWPEDNGGAYMMEWVNLCSSCGKRVAEYVGYCCYEASRIQPPG